MPSTIDVQAGNSTTFTSLIKTSDGTANLTLQTGGANALSIDNLQNPTCNSTGSITIPSGTTAQRPSPAVNGMLRYNNGFGSLEIYLANAWANVTAVVTPVNSVAPVVSGSTTVGANVTCTTGTFNNSPTSYTYQWLANTVAISANATSNVFTLTATQTGANVACNVTAFNASGNSGPITSNTVGPVVATYSASYLVVAGGGGGGSLRGGGGGAGGLLSNTATLSIGTSYTITVGAGGAGTPASNPATNFIATSGSNSTISTGIATAIGGGGGGAGSVGSSGGSGGGGTWNNNAGGSATSGQGYAGGAGSTVADYGSGGGGGSSAVGTAGSGSAGGNGGAGTASSITGSSVTYAGGGGGGINTGFSGGTGGTGGGTNGISGSASASAATANTGSGGGGAGYNGGTNSAGAGGTGGSGVVILSVPTTNYSGTTTGSPTVTTSGLNTIIKYTSSGTYTA